jgi:hypothetical protein
MSSAYQKKNGKHEISFFFRNPLIGERKRHKLQLGNCDIETRDAVQHALDQLLVCRENGLSLSPELKLWLRSLEGPLREQLAKHGLCKSRVNATVEHLCQAHLDKLKQKDSSESTIRNVTRVIVNLRKFFTPNKPIRSIRLADAREFRKWLKAHGKHDNGPLAKATASRRTRRAREIFATAIELGWIRRERNPFRKMQHWNESNSERDIYIPWEEFLRVLKWCPCPRTRFFLAITRICGIRSPSDVRPLVWSNFDIDLYIIRVGSIKNHEYRPSRDIPFFKELRRFYNEAWDDIPDEQLGKDEIFFDLPKTDTAISNRLQRYCRKAGMAMWPKPMLNLRASGERDMWRALAYDEVVAILDHSPETAQEHYNRFAKELRARAEGRALVFPDLSW